MICNARTINGLGLSIHSDVVVCVDEDEDPFECPVIYVVFLCFEVSLILGVSQ